MPLLNAQRKAALLQLKLSVLKRFLPKNDLRIASALTEVALLHAKQHPDKAAKYWDEALSIYDSTGTKLPTRSLGMQLMIRGVHRFQSNVFTQEKDLFETLSHGQHPDVLFICCSDSRIETSHLTQMPPGELFVLRHVGNIVPKHGSSGEAAEASIEFAVNAIHVKDIIICGHSHCGAINGLLHPESLSTMPAVAAFLQHAQETRERMSALPPHGSEEERLERAVEENVLVQIEHLKTHPAVALALSQGKLELHGWVYKFETGEVIYFDRPSQSWQTL